MRPELLLVPSLLVAPLAAQGFVNRTDEVGLHHEIMTGLDQVGESNVLDWTQRGFALADIDGDGDADFVGTGGLLPPAVLRNDDGVFVDISDIAGIDVGEFDSCAALADFDSDGDLDLVIGTVEAGGDGSEIPGASRFYRNDGTGVFTEITTLTETFGKGHTIFAQWADLDYDGLVDLLFAEFYTKRNIVYRNNGDSTFTDVSVEWGLDTPGSTHVTSVLDVDEDGSLDVLVGNDWIVSNWTMLPDNAGDRQFAGSASATWSDVSSGSGFDIERGVMGFALGDVNYDGRLDVYKTDTHANWLMINEAWPNGGAWHDEAEFYGVKADEVPIPGEPTEMGRAIGWSAVFTHFDFDPWIDLFVVNGQVAGLNATVPFSHRDQRNFLWMGSGPSQSFTFSDETESLGIFDEIDDRAMAIADFDLDGDVDIVIGRTSGTVRYFENQIDPAGQGFLRVIPRCRTSAAGGFGVKVSYLDSFGYVHTQQIGLSGPTASQNENAAHFGLGMEPSVDVAVEFPSGITRIYPNTLPNTSLKAQEPLLFEVNARTIPIVPASPTLVGRVGGPGVVPPSLPGAYVVTAYAYTPFGVALDETALVEIETEGLEPISPVVHIQGNEFRRAFRAPAQPGSFRTELKYNGWRCRILPRVHFYDPADASGTIVNAKPQAVQAGSSQVIDAIIAPKTADGISLGAGRSITARLGGVPATSVTDLGDGRYSAMFDAPATAGAHAVTLAVNGQFVDPGYRVDAGGAIAQKSIILKEQPFAATSATPNVYKILFQPKDANGVRLGPYVDFSIVVIEDDGTPPITIRHVDAVGQPDGEYLVLLEKPAEDPPVVASGEIEIYAEGVLFKTTTYSF